MMFLLMSLFSYVGISFPGTLAYGFYSQDFNTTKSDFVYFLTIPGIMYYLKGKSILKSILKSNSVV